MRFCAYAVIGLSLFAALAAAQSTSAQQGQLGIAVARLYDDSVADKRGALIVTSVMLAGADAGVQPGDIVTAINGQPVSGVADEVLESRFASPAGTTYKFTIVRGAKQKEIIVTSRPFAPRHADPSDPFEYTAPGDWGYERAEFPLSWAPTLQHSGFEDLFFKTGFRDRSSESYHTFAFFLWIEGKYPSSREQLQSEFEEYFRGVSQERTVNYKFTADLSKVKVRVEPVDVPPVRYMATVNFYDTYGQFITLHAEVSSFYDAATNHTELFVCLSPQDPSSPVWVPLRAIRDSFHARSALQ
jgi:hypothetical protein